MKKSLITCAFLSFFAGLTAQTDKTNKGSKYEGKETKSRRKESNVKRYDTTCIVLDPLGCCKNLNIPDFIREDSRLSIKIINVNPLAAKIQLSAKSDTVDYDIPQEFNLAFPGNKEADTAKAEKLRKMPGNQLMLSGKRNQQDSIRTEELKKTMNACLKILHGDIKALQALLNISNRIKYILATPVIRKEDLLNKINLEIECIGGDTANCCWYKIKFDELINNIHDKYACVRNAYNEYNRILSPQKSIKQIAISGVLIMPDDKKKTVKLDIKSAKADIDDKQPDENDNKMSKLASFVGNLTSDSSLQVMTGKIDSLTSMCIDLKTSGPFELCKSPYTVYGDTYTITPIVQNMKGDTVFKFEPIPFKTYGGFRLNFSTGLGFSFFNNDQSYLKEKASADSFYIRKGKVQDAFVPSIVAFLHAYWRAKHRVTPGITAGISTNPTSLQTTKFFIGGSLILGDNRRYILSAGITGTQADRLAGNFSADGKYANADYTGLQDKDLIEKKFKVGVFFGFSYNLSVKR